MQQRKIILFLIIIFIAASAWLSYASYREVDPNAGKNWWVLNFTDPSSDNLNFTIENHSNQSAFHWKVSENNQTLKEGDMTIKKGVSQNVAPDGDYTGGKFVIDVTAGTDKNNKKEIYKNL